MSAILNMGHVWLKIVMAAINAGAAATFVFIRDAQSDTLRLSENRIDCRSETILRGLRALIDIIYR